MIDASTEGSLMKLDIDNAHELYERIEKNQIIWPSERKTLRKTTRVYNVDVMTSLVAQMEVLRLKIDIYLCPLT